MITEHIITSEEVLGEADEIVSYVQGEFQAYSIGIAIVFIIIGTIGAYLISGHALKPIKSLATQIEAIDESNLAKPLTIPKTDDEISQLTNSFNNMREKLNTSFENHKLFAQNAAHELKTPLAAIRTNIEVLQLDDEPSVGEYKEVIDVTKNSTERLIELVEGLLAIGNVIDETKWQTINLNEVFKTILTDLRAEISVNLPRP